MLAAMFLVPSGGSVSAAPADGSYIASVEDVGQQEQRIHVFSAAMDTQVELVVWRPADTSEPAPILYLLNGAGGGEDAASWTAQTHAQEFFRDKHVNVVMPIGGKWSYYTDWRKPDPVLGVNEWRTFLTEEIPPLLDAQLGSTGVNTIAGLSSSGTSVLQLAIASPGLYRGVAAYSGCAQTSDPIGQRYVRTTVEVWGQGDADNMWGPNSDPEWVANDPVVHAEGLRGLALFISNGSGLPGPHDTLTDPRIDGNAPKLANQIIVGGVIEAATNYCTHNLQNRLNELGIPATYSFRDTGTHSWGYWEDDLHASWPMLATAMNIPA